MLRRLLTPALTAVFIFISCSFALQAQETKPASDKAEPKKEGKEQKEKEDGKEKDDTVETKHEIAVAGQKLAYIARAGTITLTKQYGEPRARVFSVSYLRSDTAAGAERPVCFCFNGGPGSSAVWLHLGAFGPRRAVLPESGVTAPKPPYALTDNEFTLLRDTDLVFVDPVSTGLSLAEKGEDARQFHGFTEDVQSVGDFIRLWITKHGRWGSPKFLMGESYGAIRVSGLAAHLQDRYGMFLNGIIIVSGLLDWKTLSPDDQNDVAYVAWLPSMVACAHYHRKLPPELQSDFPGTWKRAVEFARGVYGHALAAGSSLPAGERETVAAYMAMLTGLPKDFILRENLRIDPMAFRRKLLESTNLLIGRFDGRVTGSNGDPSYTVIFGAFSTLMNSYLRAKDGLQYETDRPYEILNSGAVNPWNYGRANEYFSVTGQLAAAIKDNPHLQVFVACGYHDLATPAEGINYSVRHIDLPEPLRANIHWGIYDGGHMMYTHLPSLKKLADDVSGFVKKAGAP